MAGIEAGRRNTEVILDYRRLPSITLAAAIEEVTAAVPASPAYALLYTPTDLWFGRLGADGRVIVRPRHGEDDAVRALDAEALAAVFEGRVFCGQWEFRWLKTDGENGGAKVCHGSGGIVPLPAE